MYLPTELLQRIKAATQLLLQICSALISRQALQKQEQTNIASLVHNAA